MDEELLKQAIKDRLNKQELYVLIAYKLGTTKLYDLQKLTGFRKCDVLKALEKISRYINIEVNNINTSLPGKNFQTPPREIFHYLNSRFDNKLPCSPMNQAACKQMYLKARETTSTSEDAVQLVKDCIDETDFSKARMPFLFLRGVFNNFIAMPVPEMPVEIWERVTYKHEQFRYNRNAKTWERREVAVA